MHLFYRFALSLFLLSTLAPAARAQCPVPATCTPGAASDPNAALFGMGILNVTLGTLNHNSAGVTDGYQNCACTLGTALAAGARYPVSIRTNPAADERVRVWIDYNNDGTFSPVTELFFVSGPARLHAGISNLIPATAVLGVPLRLRVSADAATSSLPTPCSTPQLSQVEDYAVTLGAVTQPPVAAFQLNAALTQPCTGVFAFSDLSQRGVSSWRWSFGDGTTSPLADPTHTYTQPGRYVVKLRVCNPLGCDSTVATDTLSWYPPLPVAASCAPATVAYCCGYGITAVALAGQTQLSANGAAGYEDFTCRRRFTLVAGVPYTLSVTGGANPQEIRAWLDANNDGQFTAAEQVLVQSSGLSASANLVVPATAVQNVPLRLRVMADGVGAGLNPCQGPQLGQAEDYGVVVLPQGSCTSVPTLAALRGQYDPCANPQATLWVPSPPAGWGLQWQRSPDAQTWVDVAGATNDTLVTSAVTGRVYYRATTACGSLLSATDAWALDTVRCYCTNVNSPNSCSRYHLRDLRIGGTPFHFAQPPCSGAFYQSGLTYGIYPPSRTALLHRSSSYYLQGQLDGSGFVSIYIWIDLNQNGVFEPTEKIPQGTSPRVLLTNGTGYLGQVIPIPPTALLGRTTMRIRTYASGPLTACQVGIYGETFDFQVTIGADTTVAGVSIGTVQGRPTYCLGQAPQLHVTGASYGALLQWQVSPDSLTWTDLPNQGLDTLVAPAVTPWDTAHHYVRVKASNGTAVAYTPAVRVQPDFLLCYCTHIAANCGEPALKAVRLGNTPLYDQATVCPGGSYRYADPSQPHLTATLVRGAAYPLILRPATNPTTGAPRAAFDVVAWIDYDHDGQFREREKTVLRVYPVAADTVATLQIPTWAELGPTRLRIIARPAGRGTFVPNDACSYDSAQEVRDYLITVVEVPGTALLTAGTLRGTTTTVHASGGLPVYAEHYSFDAQLQWEAIRNGGWQEIPGETRDRLIELPVAFQLATIFRLRATRGAAVVYSAPITLLSGLVGYCTTGLLSSTLFANFQQATIAGRGAHWLHTLRQGQGGRSYQYFASGQDSLSVTLYRGQTYLVGLGFGSGGTNPQHLSGIWLDANHNTFYETYEFADIPSFFPGSPRLGQLTVPDSAALGYTRLRLRYLQGRSVQGTQACGAVAIPSYPYQASGEVRDYLVWVADAPAFVAPELSGPDSVCLGAALQLVPTPALPAGTTYRWEGPGGWVSTAPQGVRPNATAALAGRYLLTATAPNGYQLTMSRTVAVDTTCRVLGQPAPRVPLTVTLAPNPATGQTLVRVQGTARALEVRLLSATGQELRRAILAAGSGEDRQLILSLAGYPAGLYMVQVLGAEGVTYRKLVVQ